MRHAFPPFATRLLPALVLLALSCPAHAGDIEVTSPWLRATPKGASVAAGYATITNKGTAADTLIGASLPVAKRGEIHEMSMSGGVMKMRQLAHGLAIPAGQSVTLAPGGYHLMFQNPTKPLKEGETVTGELTFAKAGKVRVDFPVAGFGAKAAPQAMPGMKAMPGMNAMPGMKGM